MRDHQFDWNQVYSLLDHINDLTKSMNQMTDKPSQKGNDVSSRQQSHAREDANQLTAHAIKSLQAMRNIDAAYKKALCTKIRHLNDYNQKVLGKNPSNFAQHQLVKGTKLQLRKIVAHARLDDVSQSLIDQINKASLSKEQQNAAISEIESTRRYSVNDLTNCQKLSGVHNIITSSINAMNGALVKYIVDSKIDDINQLNNKSRQVRAQVAKNPKLDDTLKKIAKQAIESARTQAVVDLMTQSNDNFKQLSRIKRRGFAELKHVLTSIKNLKALGTFVDQVKKSVVVSVPLTVNGKFQLKQRIDRFYSVVINNFQGAYRYFTSTALNHEKCRLAIIIIKMVNTQYQVKVTSQALDLNSDQQNKLAGNIKRTAHALCQDFVHDQDRKPIEVHDVVDSLSKLQRIVDERQAFAYSNQVMQLVKDAQLQIDQFSDFSAADKHYLWILVANFGKSIQTRKPRMSLAKVRAALHELFVEQVRYIENYSLKYQFEDLTHQIDASHLSKAHSANLLQQLDNVQQNSRLNYSNKLLFLKTIQNYSMVLDQNQNLSRLSTLSKSINKKVDTEDVLVLRQRLEQNLFNFNQEIDKYQDPLSLDHYEQTCENKVYRIWFKIVIHGNQAKRKQFNAVMKLMNAAHRRVKLAVLQSWLNHTIVDQIDQAVNRSLMAIGDSYDMDKIKAEPGKLDQRIKNLFKQVLVQTKQTYSNEIDRVVRDVQSRLVAYPSFKSVVGKIGLVRSRAMTRIDNFADLLHVEYVKQANEANLYQIVGHVVDAGNSTKRLAHQQVQKMVKSVKKELLSHKSSSKAVNLAFINRILLVQNHADACIDQDLNRQVNDEIKHCRNSLGLILRRHYLHRWSRMVDRSRAAVNNLDSIAADVRQSSLDSIMSIKGSVATKLGTDEINGLYRILNTNRRVLNQITRHAIYLDPVKKRAFGKLHRLTHNTRQYVNLHSKGKIKQFIFKRLTAMEHRVREQISTCPDEKVDDVYKSGSEKITGLRLNIVRGVKMRNFTILTNSVTKRTRNLKFLSPSQKRSFNIKFNRSYHKVIYDIKHSPDVTYGVKNERNGEKQINQLFAQINRKNGKKQKFYTDVAQLVQEYRHDIQELRYIDPNDKANSDKLLLQAQKQCLKKVRAADDVAQLEKIQKSSKAMAQQIVNEVSSANVLLAAIRSADDLVAKSNLNDKQKKVTLHQIHEIFNDGIKAQQNNKLPNAKKAKKQNDQNDIKLINNKKHRQHQDHLKAQKRADQARAKAEADAKADEKRQAAQKKTQPTTKQAAPEAATVTPQNAGAHWSVMTKAQFKRAMRHERIHHVTRPIRNVLKKLGHIF